MRSRLSYAGIIVGTTLMALAFLCACLCGARAQETTLAIRPLRDGGGLERGLNTRLTTALAHFLTDHAAKSVQVNVEGNPASSQAPKTLRYTLEGDLTFANGADEQNARFLLVMRLFRESTSRALIGQWAGTADSLRSLTVNLRRDPRVHALGLVGEIGSRIVSCLNADTTTVYAQWSSLLSQVPAQNSLFDIVSADNKARSMRLIEAGHSFHLRSRRDISCRAFLLLNGPANGLHLARLSDEGECWTVSKGKMELSHPVVLPEGVMEAWVVTGLPGIENTRLNGVPPSVLRTQLINTTFRVRRTLGRRPLRQGFSTPGISAGICGICGIPGVFGIADQNDAPVLMLEGIGNQASHSEPAPALKQMLDEIKNTPEAWRVQKLRITETK